jgi:hypothetical protein
MVDIYRSENFCRRMRIIQLIALCLSFASVGLRAEEALKNPLPDIIAQSAFCVAYVIRDPDARDIRPNDRGDPFKSEEGEGVRHGNILGSDSLIDVDTLTSRLVAQARISKENLTTTYKAVIDGNSHFPVMECYDPHHAIIFYSNSGKPVCCIEICFTCNRVKISPEFRTLTPTDHSYERTDIIALARVFEDLKLPLSPFKSFEEFKKGKEALSKMKLDPEPK